MDNLPCTAEEHHAWWKENAPVPYGLCWCGCGARTNSARDNDVSKGYVKGCPVRVIRGHRILPAMPDGLPDDAQAYRKWWAKEQPDIPYGLCWCGCGEKTRISERTYRGQLWFAGESVRYVLRHYNRNWGSEYVEEDRGHATPCWIWQMAVSGTGYGRIQGSRRRQTTSIQAHRAYYERYKGPIEPGKHLDHLCRVPLCVNPEHLEPVSNAENAQRGNTARLTADDVRRIRTLCTLGVPRKQIAQSFSIVEGHVYAIMRRDVWRNV